MKRKGFRTVYVAVSVDCMQSTFCSMVLLWRSRLQLPFVHYGFDATKSTSRTSANARIVHRSCLRHCGCSCWSVTDRFAGHRRDTRGCLRCACHMEFGNGTMVGSGLGLCDRGGSCCAAAARCCGIGRMGGHVLYWDQAPQPSAGASRRCCGSRAGICAAAAPWVPRAVDDYRMCHARCIVRSCDSSPRARCAKACLEVPRHRRGLCCGSSCWFGPGCARCPGPAARGKSTRSRRARRAQSWRYGCRRYGV